MQTRATQSLRIALEASSACALARTGVARFAVSLLDALAARDDVDLTVLYRLSRMKRRSLCHVPFGTRMRWLKEPLLPLFGRTPLVHGLDARVPIWPGAVRTATIHDVFSLVSDQFATAEFRAKKRRGYLDLARNAHHLVCDSQSTRTDLLRHVDCRPEDVSVVPLGVRKCFTPEAAHGLPELRTRLSLPAQYFLFVGQLSIRKNLVRLVEAYARSRASKEFSLVLAGAKSFGFEALEDAVVRLRLTERVRMLGHVDDDDLPTLYAGARVFCFPTLYEGFGLPVLEALRSGVPVLSSSISAIPEVAAEHAVLVDPTDVDAISWGLERALDVDAARIASGRRHAERFTWERCASAYVDVWSRVLDARRQPA